MGRGIALLFLERGTRRGWVVSSTPRPHFTPGKDPLPILQLGGPQGRSGRAENLVTTGIFFFWLKRLFIPSSVHSLSFCTQCSCECLSFVCVWSVVLQRSFGRVEVCSPGFSHPAYCYVTVLWRWRGGGALRILCLSLERAVASSWSIWRTDWAKNLFPNGIRSRTVQPVVGRCIDWATRPTEVKYALSSILYSISHA